MPIYSYECTSCKSIIKAFRNVKQADSAVFCKTCGRHDKQNRLLPNNVSGRALENRDEYRNKNVLQDTERLVEDRAKEHWKKHDLPKLIELEGMDAAIKRGWVDPETKRPK